MEERFPIPQFHDDDSDYPGKRSTLAKLKEKAKKWRHTLTKIRSRREVNGGTPPWEVSLEEGDSEVRHHAQPKYASEKGHRASSKRLSSWKKSTMRQLSSTATMESEMKLYSDAIKVVPAPEATAATNDRKLARAATFAAAYAGVSGATRSAAPKIPEHRPGCEFSAAWHVWDAGLSVKEYLWQKLEPGEADRALCEVITEAVNPKYPTRFASVAANTKEPVPVSMA